MVDGIPSVVCFFVFAVLVVTKSCVPFVLTLQIYF